MLFRSLILTGAINGLFFILLLKVKVKNTNSDRLLMFWMGIIALQLLFYYDNLSAIPIFPGCIQLLGFSLPLISSPVLYFYIASLSFGMIFKWRSMLIHMLPFLLFNCITFFLQYISHDGLFLKDGLPHFGNHVNLVFIYTLTGLLAIVPAYYTCASFIILLRHKKMLADNYSYTEKINLDWLRWIVISLIMLFIGLFLLIKYGVNYGLIGYPQLFAVVGTVLTGYVFFIGFCGLKQSTVLNNIPEEGVPDNKDTASPGYKNSGLSDDRVEEIFKRLIRHMEVKEPFLKDDLSLGILAGQLNITTNQLSQVINQKSQSNFFNFVNNYRVKAVKAKLKDPAMAHYSILGIAYDCGFRSKSSFNKIFKEVTGQTPLQYQKSTG